MSGATLQQDPAGAVLADPRWFPEAYGAGRFTFVETTREELAAQAFLDGRWNRDGRGRKHLSVATLSGGTLPATSPHFIWHTAFCCSTLIARALDKTGCNLSLCEPQILLALAQARRAGDVQAPPLGICLLGRGFSPGEQVTIKPAPGANVLIGDAARGKGRMLFLYSDCRSFLIAVAKHGEAGRRYARSRFVTLLGEHNVLPGWPIQQIMALTDLQVAALTWHMQIAEMRSHALGGRGVSLDCDAFLADPAGALGRLDAHFGLDLGTAHIGEVLAGPLFARNAKNADEEYRPGKRQDDHANVAAQLGEDLDRTVRWSYEVCQQTPRGVPLADPLIPIDKVYCP